MLCWFPAATVRLESLRGVRESGRRQLFHRQLSPWLRRFRGGAKAPSSVLPPLSASAGWACSPAARRRRRPEKLRYGGLRSRGGRVAPLRMGFEAPLRPRTGAGRPARPSLGCGPGRRGRACGPDGVVTVRRAAASVPGPRSGRDRRAAAVGRRRGRSAFLTGEIGSNGTLSGPRRTLGAADFAPEACRLGLGRAAGDDRLLSEQRSRTHSGTGAESRVAWG